MRWLELVNVEYGECTVLIGKGPSALMVDCGSMNNRLRRPDMEMRDVFSFIQARYGSMARRDFLLTHYHRDHMCGFLQILKSRPDYYSAIYLPWLPMGEAGQSPLLEFALYAHMFAVPQSDAFQVNTACLDSFGRLAKAVGTNRIFTIKDKDRFLFDNTGYEVLNPPSRGFPFGKVFLEGVAALQGEAAAAPGQWTRDFLEAKALFVRQYHRCQQVFSLMEHAPEAVRTRSLELLDAAFGVLEALRPQAGLCPAAEGIRALLAGQSLREAYSGAVNDASVVFHNRRTVSASPVDLLMTGDVSGSRLEALAPRLYPEYHTVKAPHHGTESGYTPLLCDLSPGHLLISSGDYQAGGELAAGYAHMGCMKHCTNRARCGFYKANKECCARLNYCPSLPGLALKCPAIRQKGLSRPCGIYVVAPGGDPLGPAPKKSLSCFCDQRTGTP